MLFTSESVSEGHPDKLCDQVSDAILDACLKEDPDSKVACETSAKTGFIIVFGEITTKANLNFQEIVRNTVRKIGYNDSSTSFDADTCAVLVAIEKQSPEINKGVFKKDAENQGAGDQGMMFGYATNETKEMHPLTHVLSHKLLKRLTQLRKNNTFKWALPDAKSQVTVEYEDLDGELKPKRVHTVLISTQHKDNISNTKIKSDIIKHVIKKIIPSSLIDSKTRLIVNPSGSFFVGGPKGDAGLTGRKIIVDTYGGWGSHGGGAFSGKDPSKVDRSGAYAARWVAKSLVFNKLASRVLVQISYGIGIAKPISILVNSYGTGVVPDEILQKIVENNFDLRPYHIIKDLKLKRPIYQNTAAYGHFGQINKDFTWETPKKIIITKNKLSHSKKRTKTGKRTKTTKRTKKK